MTSETITLAIGQWQQQHRGSHASAKKMFHIGQLMTGKNPPDDRSHITFSHKTLVEVLDEDNFNNNWGIESACRSARGSAYCTGYIRTRFLLQFISLYRR